MGRPHDFKVTAVAVAFSMPPRTWVSIAAGLPAWLAIAAVEATRSRSAVL
jgi:hypothetical protein